MENEVTTVKNIDWDFLDLGGVEKNFYLTETDLGDFLILFPFRLLKFFSHKYVLFSVCYLHLFQNGIFTS